MRAERDRRALILTAEGTKQSAILTAEGARQAEILRAEGDKQAAVLRAQGEAEAIQTVFNAIHVRQPRRQAARLPVPADASQDRRQRIEQALDHPERVHRGAQGNERRVRRVRRRMPASRPAPRASNARRRAAAAVTHPWFEGASRPRVLAHRGLLTAEDVAHGVVENSFAAVAAAHAGGGGLRRVGLPPDRRRHGRAVPRRRPLARDGRPSHGRRRDGARARVADGRHAAD